MRVLRSPATGPADAAPGLIAEWRPQAFGKKNSHAIVDPLIEPLWEGLRVLVAVTDSHVDGPIDAWLGSWRSLGFHSLAYKAANSRYRPGQPNDSWAIARIPTR